MQVVVSGPQLMAESPEFTLPRPLPAFVRGSVGRLKGAVTERAALMVTLQLVPEAVSQPLQPVKVEPPSGVAVSVTAVFASNAAAQVDPQSMPAGLDVTRPVPLRTSVSVGRLPTLSVVLP